MMTEPGFLSWPNCVRCCPDLRFLISWTLWQELYYLLLPRCNAYLWLLHLLSLRDKTTSPVEWTPHLYRNCLLKTDSLIFEPWHQVQACWSECWCQGWMSGINLQGEEEVEGEAWQLQVQKQLSSVPCNNVNFHSILILEIDNDSLIFL